MTTPRDYGARWTTQASKTPQELGRVKEVGIVRRYGGRTHPGSGSGRIQFDGSSEDDLIEVKHARASFTVQLRYIARLFGEATKRGKNARIVLVFDEGGYEVEMTIRRKNRVVRAR